MDWIEVLEIVIAQVGDLRVPMREKELRDSLDMILQNLGVLKGAMEEAKEKQNGGDGQKDDAGTPAGAEVRDSV